jgi:polyhydroxyalkanoate synthesis regulator protein
MSVKTTIQVRKYGNRKLYDEEHATYVSMLDLSGLVADGAKVQVTCDLTGRDMTLETLARALYERSKEADAKTDREAVVRGLARIIEQISTTGEGSKE